MKKPGIFLRNYQCSTRRESRKKIASKNTVMNALRGLPVKESSSLEKKIKASKASGLPKKDNGFKGPCWTTWLQGWHNWTLSPTPTLRADCISPGPPAPVHPQTAISAKDYPERTAWLSPPLLLLQNLPLNMKPPWPRTLCLVLRPAVAPPCLNKGSFCWGRLPFFTTLSGTLPTPEPCGRMWRTWTAPHSQVDSQVVQW